MPDPHMWGGPNVWYFPALVFYDLWLGIHDPSPVWCPTCPHWNYYIQNPRFFVNLFHPVKTKLQYEWLKGVQERLAAETWPRVYAPKAAAKAMGKIPEDLSRLHRKEKEVELKKKPFIPIR